MTTLEDLINNPEICNNLLEAIDYIAQSSGNEYGLPIYKESDKSRLREVIYKWVIRNFIDEKHPLTVE